MQRQHFIKVRQIADLHHVRRVLEDPPHIQQAQEDHNYYYHSINGPLHNCNLVAYVFDNHIIYRDSMNMNWEYWFWAHLCPTLQAGNVPKPVINFYIQNLDINQLLQYHSDQLPKHLQDLPAECEGRQCSSPTLEEVTYINAINMGEIEHQHQQIQDAHLHSS